MNDLLQPVGELALYTIKQEKEIEKQNKKIEELEEQDRRIEELERKIEILLGDEKRKDCGMF